jgi:hypothetical protein
MEFKYYIHDNKEDTVEQCFEILKSMGQVQTRDQMYNHPLYEKIFSQLFKNEIAMVYDIDSNGNCVLKEIQSQDGDSWKVV